GLGVAVNRGRCRQPARGGTGRERRGNRRENRRASDRARVCSGNDLRLNGVIAMKDVVIVAATRTAIGSFQGALATVSAVDLGAAVIQRLLEQTGVPGAQVNDVILEIGRASWRRCQQ